MDVVLGVAVTGRVARLAMIGSPGSGGQVLDQYALDLTDGDATADLADTIVGTYRAVADSGNRVAATRLTLPDASQAETLRQTVSNAGVQNVEVVTEAEAAAALARSVGADAALLLADDETVSLEIVGEDEESTSVLASMPIGSAGVAVACAAVLAQVPESTTRVMLVGQRLDLDSVAAELSSTAAVEVPPDPGFAIARGAAQTADDAGFAPAGAATQMAPAAGDATQMAPASGATQMAPAAGDATQMAPATAADGVVGPLLAYSQDEPDYYEMPAEAVEEFVPEQEDESTYTAVIAPPPPRTLLVGSAMAFLVMSFTTLAVAVAVNIRPVADVEAQPVPPVQSETVPGRYLPQLPHDPDPVALPVAVVSPAPAAPAMPRIRTNQVPAINNVRVAPPVVQPGQGVPGVPVPVPEVPGIPLPPPVFPPWSPFPLPTFPWPTYTTPTSPTTTSPTTTTTSPTTTSPTTSTSTSTTTSTSVAPPPILKPVPQPEPAPEPAYKPPALAPEPKPAPAQVAPAPAIAPAPAVAPAPAPAQVAPAPAIAPAPAPLPVAPAPAIAPAPAPVIPEAPSSGSGSSSGGGGSVQAPATTPMLSP